MAEREAWRLVRELAAPPDPSPRVSELASPRRSWASDPSSSHPPATASTSEASDEDDSEPETCLYLARRGRFLTGGVGAVGRPAGVTRRSPPLHAYVSSRTGKGTAPLGQDDTTVRHRCGTHGVHTAYALEEMGTKRHDDSDDDDDDDSMFSLDGDAREPLHRAERANRQRAAAETAARREARLVERARRRRHSATVRRGPACVQPRGCQPWIHPWDDPEPKTLRQLCVHALAGVLRETTSLPRAMPADLINATMDKCRLDPRILAMCLMAGATKLHLRDFASIPDEPLTSAWRCWQAGTTVDVPRPPPERSTPIPACMVEPIDGILHPRRDGWTELFALADTLETVIIECGDSGEDDESHRYLSEVIAGLCGTRALSRMALGFFERVTDETLAPIWGGGGGEIKGEKNNGEGEVTDLPPLTSSSRANRGALVPSIPVHVPVRAPPALTRLDLSHLPNVTDATVRSTLCHVPTLTKLRLEFLPVTDACISDWRATLANLEWLEVTSCPYMRFAFPDVDWLHPPNKLRTLRIQPGGSRNIPKGADRDQRDMRVSARHLHQLSFAKRSAIVHLCLGCEFAAPEGENRRLGVGGNVGGYRSETVWDLRDAPLRGVTHLELYRTRQIIWPRRVSQWTDCLESLVIETVDDGLIHRLVGVKTLRRLVICDCGDMDVDEFVAIGKLKNLTELRCGGVTERLGPFAGDVTCAIGRGLVEAHFHVCVEYPVEESLFD